jgi:hypothetical protein
MAQTSSSHRTTPKTNESWTVKRDVCLLQRFRPDISALPCCRHCCSSSFHATTKLWLLAFVLAPIVSLVGTSSGKMTISTSTVDGLARTKSRRTVPTKKRMASHHPKCPKSERIFLLKIHTILRNRWIFGHKAIHRSDDLLYLRMHSCWSKAVW